MSDDLSSTISTAVVELFALALEHPVALIFIAATIAAVHIWAAPPRPSATQDPARAFSPEVRRAGFELAGGRCEMGGLLRCRVNATHGDHFIPWVSGGSSGPRNFVAACAHHNLSKGAKMPGRIAQLRIESRRRRYYPAGTDRRVGERAHDRMAMR